MDVAAVPRGEPPTLLLPGVSLAAFIKKLRPRRAAAGPASPSSQGPACATPPAPARPPDDATGRGSGEGVAAEGAAGTPTGPASAAAGLAAAPAPPVPACAGGTAGPYSEQMRSQALAPGRAVHAGAAAPRRPEGAPRERVDYRGVRPGKPGDWKGESGWKAELNADRTRCDGATTLHYFTVGRGNHPSPLHCRTGQPPLTASP